jgi:hypothetical protein
MSESVIVDKIPDCDLCKSRGENVPAVVDAKTQSGPWAYMCDEDFEANGIRLGTGWGQQLILRENA